jgi:Glycosyl transferase family 2
LAQRALGRAGLASRGEVAALRAQLEAGVAEQQRRLDWAGQRLDMLEQREGRRDQLVEELKNQLRVDALDRWLSHTALQTEPLVSVITPTRNRPAFLRRAIESVLAQRYPNWELLVVDDGGGEDSAGVVESFGDPRLSWRQIPHSGPGAARNAALRDARGEIVAYLDDDNIMDAGWLFAVVWAFEQRADVDTLYGAIVIDDPLRVAKAGSGEMPWIYLRAFSREALLEGNLADMSAIAHRADLEGAWFDEAVLELVDWDLLARLTGDKDPLVLPAIACYYTTDAPERLTMGPTFEQDKARITARVAESLGP